MPPNAPSPISIIEDFYGEELTAGLLRKITSTPRDQLMVLADRIVRYNRSLQDVFERRAAAQSAPLVTSFDSLIQDPITIWDDLYFRKTDGPALTESPSFKHALIYTNRLMIADYSLDWAEQLISPDVYWGINSIPYSTCRAWSEANAGADLADNLREVLPILPLVRRGVVVLVASPDWFDVRLPGTERDEYHTVGSTRFRCVMGESDIYWQDPYLAWWYVHSIVRPESWELEALDLHRPGDIQEAARYFLAASDSAGGRGNYGEPHLELRTAYGSVAEPEDVYDALMLNRLCQAARLMPITTSTVSRSHLTRSAKVTLDGIAAQDVVRHDPIAMAARYRVPPVANVSISDLIQLRMQEEIYEDVRRCLKDLASEVNECSPPDNYRSYEKLVYSAAEDLVRPAYERLNSRRRREKLRALVAGYAVGSLVTMGINGLASVLSGPGAFGVRHAASAIGTGSRRQVSRRVGSHQSELSIACSILLSVIDQTSSTAGGDTSSNSG